MTAVPGRRVHHVGARLRTWALVLVGLQLCVALAGAGNLVVGGALRADLARLDAVAHASDALLLSAVDAGGAGSASRRGTALEDASRTLLRAADAVGLQTDAQREVTAVQEWAAVEAQDDAQASRLAAVRSVHDVLRTAVEDRSAEVAQRESLVRHVALGVVFALLAGSLVVSGLLLVWLRRWLVMPLAALQDVLAARARGELGRRADVDAGPVEVRAVAAGVNVLAEHGDRMRDRQVDADRLRRLAAEVGRLARDPMDPTASVQSALKLLGEGLGVDRVWLRQLDEAGVLGALEGSWSREGAPPVVEDVGVAGRGIPTWLQEMWDARGHFAVDDLRGLVAAGEATAATVDFVERTGATSLVTAPIGAGEAAIGTLTAFTHDGPRSWREDETTLLASVAADLGRATVVARLLHDSEMLVEQLRELDVRKSTFLATVSHELRTPLTSIAGYVEMIREGGAGEVSDGVDRMLSVIERNTVRLRVLIEDLLALSNIESGAARGVHDLVRLGDVVRGVAEEHRGAAQAGGVAVEVDVDVDAELLGALVVPGDETSLRRVVAGLVSNAVKFTPSGGSVALRVLVDEDGAVVEVEDTGIGIPVSEQGGLFTRFFRASNATALAVPGAGLGLTIARSLVEHHDGRLQITSAEGEGTTARVLLPRPRPATDPRP